MFGVVVKAVTELTGRWKFGMIVTEMENILFQVVDSFWSGLGCVVD